MKTLQLTAPSAWAPAIVNLEYSGLPSEDVSALNMFLAREGVSFSDCLHYEDAGFLWRHDAFKEMPIAASCQKYYFKIAGGHD